MSTFRRSGLSLIEIMVATTLIAILTTTATTAFVQMRNLTKRIELRQQLHNSARIIYERMSWEVSCLAQGSAVFVTGKSSNSTEVVFLRGKLDHLDFTTYRRFGLDSDSLTDLVWTRWYWDASRRQISVATSSTDRQFRADANWTFAGYNYKDKDFRNLPTPQRVVIGGSAASTLNANAYGTGSTGDIGDYQDLLNNSTPIAINCTDFRVELVCQDGSVFSTSPAADTAFAANGQLVDGRGGSDLQKRPRLIRIRFDLTAPGTTISETFSFSFQAPALLPGP